MSQTPDPQSPDINPAFQRRWLYGFNLALLVIVGVAIIGFIMYMGEVSKERAAWDMSSNAVNSLSSSSRALLREIDAHGKDYQLVTLFTDPTPNQKAEGDKDRVSEKRRQVRDLLHLYARNSSHITMEDQGDAASEEIERRIRDRYKDELKPYEDAAAGFDEVAAKFKAFLSGQSMSISAKFAGDGVPAEDRDDAASLSADFRKIEAQTDDALRAIHKQRNEVLPQWGSVINDLKDELGQRSQEMEILAEPDKLKQHFGDGVVSYFKDHNKEFKDMAAALKSYKENLEKLEQLKVQDVIQSLHRNSIVVLGPDSAKIFSSYEVFDTTPSRDNPEVSSTIFKGEELVSSALLSMAHPDKVKVVFISPSPQHPSEGDYSDMAATLKENNFEVLDWSPPSPPRPGGPPPDAPEPPALGKGVVWVVFPPDAPQMPFGPQPDNTAITAVVQKHVDQGGHVMFLAAPGGSYAYDSLVKSFGINVLSKYTAVQVIETQDRSGSGDVVQRPAPYIVLQHFEKSQVTDPVQSLPLVLYPSTDITALDLLKPLPSGITAQLLIRTPRSPDYFATTSFSRTGTPKFNPDTDMASPVPVAALAVRNAGQKDAQGRSSEQRILVVGCKNIAVNQILEAVQPVIIGNQVVPQPIFPGNEEFMRNAILWLSGYENMIAVSSKTNAAERIIVPETSLAVIRYVVLPVATLLALAVGGLVWLARRR